MGRRGCPVVGLAGGIGSGKSTIAGIFERLGAVIVDADRLAHRVLDLPETKERVRTEFGDGVFEGGSISRPALAKAAFGDRRTIDRLNSIVHPPVIRETKRIIRESRRAGCAGVVIDAPLLFEAGLDALCDAIVFVEADRGTRARRLRDSRGWPEGEVERRESFQDSLIEKRRRADYIIDNSRSPEEAAAEAGRIWRRITGCPTDPE